VSSRYSVLVSLGLGTGTELVTVFGQPACFGRSFKRGVREGKSVG